MLIADTFYCLRKNEDILSVDITRAFHNRIDVKQQYRINILYYNN